ncbi:Insulinoma-associated [Sparganum proliferum]
MRNRNPVAAREKCDSTGNSSVMTSGLPVTATLSALPAHLKRFKEAEQTEGSLFQNFFSTLETFRALRNFCNPAQTADFYHIGSTPVQPRSYLPPTAASAMYRSPTQTLALTPPVRGQSGGFLGLQTSYGRCGFPDSRLLPLPSAHSHESSFSPPASSSPSTASSLSSMPQPGLEVGALPRRRLTGDAELREFVCRLCGRDFNCALNLAQHHCPGIVQTTYNCYECEKVFTCSANLASHQRWHRPKLARLSLPILRTSRPPSSSLTFKHCRQVRRTKPPPSHDHRQHGSTVASCRQNAVTDFSIENLLRPDRKQQQQRCSGTSSMHAADSPSSVSAQVQWSPVEGPQKCTPGDDRPSTCFRCGRAFNELTDLEDHILDHIFLPTVC